MLAMLGFWLLAVGLPFALSPTATSRVADRLRGRPQPQIPHQQVTYARRAGIAVAVLGAAIAVFATVGG